MHRIWASRSTLYRWVSNYSKPDSDSEKEHIPTIKDYYNLTTLRHRGSDLENQAFAVEI